MIIERSRNVYYGYPTINVYYDAYREDKAYASAVVAEAKRWGKEMGRKARVELRETDTYSTPTLTRTYRVYFMDE